MTLKPKKIEVLHKIAAGSLEELNGLVSAWLVDGWEPLETRMLMFDRANRILEVLYILVRKSND